MLLSVMPTTFGVFAEEVTEAESTEGESTVTITPAFTVSPGLDKLKFNTSNLPSGGWAAIYTADITDYKTANPSNPDAGYADWISVSPTDTSITFPSGDSSRHFNWPLHTGDWKVVIFADGGYTNPVATAEFSVVEPTTFTLDNETPKVGETISFSYDKSTSDNDWIAIYDASYTDTTKYIEYVYTKGGSGTVQLANEYPEGNYVAVYYHNNSYLPLETIKFTVMEDKEVDPNGIYVSAAGSDTNAGTPDAPIKTIARAIEVMGVDKDFNLYVMGASYPFGTDIAHTGTVTIKPYDINASLAGGTIKLNGPTKIHVNTAKAVNFYPNGYYLELDGDVNRNIHNNLFVGNSEGRPNRVALNGQYVRYVACFSDEDDGSSDTLITVDGSYIYMVCPTPVTTGSTAKMGDIRMMVNSGNIEFFNIYNAPADNSTDKSLTFVFNNNSYFHNFTWSTSSFTNTQDWGTSKIWFKGGEMLWRSADTDGNYIIPKSSTEFEVVGDKTAYYQTSDKTTVYYSVDGKLNLPVLSNHTKAGDEINIADVLWTDNFSTDNFTLPEGANYWKETAEGVLTASYYTPDDIYVSLNGSDGADGVGTEEAPLATIAEAIKRKGTDVDFTIYVMGAKYAFGEDIPHTGTITLEPADDTATLAGGTIKLNGPTKIHVNNAGAIEYYPNGYFFELDGTVINRNIKSNVHVGNIEGRFNEVVLKGQYIDNVYNGVPGQQGGDSLVTIDGAHLYQIRPTPATNTVEPYVTMANFRVVLKSGEFRFFNTSNDTYTGFNKETDSYYVYVFNNDTFNVTPFTFGGKEYSSVQDFGTKKVWYKGGAMVWKSSDTDGNYIIPKSITEYDVVGTKTAYYQTSDKKTVYYSVDGKITLPNLGIKSSAAAFVSANILWAEEFSTDILATPAAENGRDFVCWQDMGDGKLVARYYPMPTNFNYYVKAGGTGDGTSVDSPAPTLAAVVNKINEDGHDATTGEVNVYIIDSGEPRDVGVMVQRADMKNYVTLNHTYNHTAKINFTTYDYANTKKTAVIYNTSDITPYTGKFHVMGNESYKDLIYIDTRTDYRMGIYMQGYDFELNNFTYRRLNISARTSEDLDGDGKAGQYGDNKVLHNQKTEAEIVTENTAEMLSYTNRGGTGTAGKGGRVILDGASNYKDIFFGGYTDSNTGITIAGDQIIELNGVKNKAVVFSGCATSKTYNYNGDVSLVLNGTTGITFKSTAKANIAGAVQVILNNGSTFTPSFTDYAISTSGGDVPYYVMNSGNEAGALDATANAGEFKINANGLYAYAFREGGREVYYGKDILKVVEDGEYTVKYVASVEDIIKSLDGVFTSDPTTGMLFKGWKDDGNGTLTAILEQKVPETKEYYVMYGGTGDGRSATAPAATVSDVVKSVNEDLIFGDTAKVYIMNNGNPLVDNVGKKSTRETLVKGTFTAWAEGGYQLSEKHYPTLHITSYDPDPDDGVAPAHTHLAYSEYIGANHSMALTGPVIFDNITIVRPRNVDREIYLGGNNVTFTDSVLIAQAKADFYQGVAFSGIEYAKNHIALGYGSAAHNNAQVVRINSPVTAAGNNHGISLSSSANTNFNAPVSLYLNNEAINSQVSWSIGDRTTNFNAGLNIITDAIGTITYPSGNYAKGTVNVTGGLQMINNNGYKFPELPENAVYDSLWIMNSAKDAGGTLDVTETAGTFKITEGKYAFVQSADNKTITYATGTITLPAGEYNVRYADSAASIMELATKPSDVDVYNIFDKWVDDGNGTMTAQYKYVINTYYVSATGSDDNDGATADTAYATIAKAIETIEATGLNGLVFIIGDVKFAPIAHKQTVYYESHNGGTLSGENNVITLAGPTSIKADFAAAQTIYMNGHDLILGGAVDTAEKNVIYAGNTAGVDANITLLGKFVDKIYTHVAAQQSGDINVVIEGGTLSQLITGTGVVNDGSYLVDSIRVTLNDGEFYSYTHTDNSAHKAAGTFEFIANGGKYYFDGERTVEGNTITEWFDDSPNGADGFVKIQYDAGKYVIRSADTENNLSVTETAGVYAYDGAKTPYYVSETGLNIYYGIDGKVKLTTGTVDVKWIDEFKADSMPAPALPDGFVFEGWTDDGNGTLTANVIDPNFFYVDETKGKDTNNGSEEEPFKTVAHAIASLDGKTGYVYVITSATYDVTDAHNGLVTIKGTSDASTIKFVGDVKLAGSTKLENIAVTLADNTVIGTNGNRFEISENVTAGDIAIATGVTDSEFDKVVLQSVTADITVGDSDNTTVYVKDSTVGITLGDTDASSAVKVTADNTTITSIDTADKEFASLEVISNGKLIDAEVEVSDNTWYVSSEATDAVIDQTETAGVFGVKAPYGKLPVAIGEDGKIYVADSYTSEDIAPDTWYERSTFDQYINYRKPLNNTYKKLTEDKELTVAYFGGSMTAGSGSSSPNLYSWRGLTGQWLKDNFPDAKITNINRACGESGSYLGTFRLQTDVIAVKPDLMFLEYSINDKYYGSYYATAALQVETILREMKQVLPETDIVFVLVTDRSALPTNKKGELHTQAQAHEDMATKYGYSTLHVGRRLAEYVNYDANVWPTYATDGVHLKDSGYRVYYDVIEEFMYNSLFCTDFEGLRERNEELLPVQSEHLMDGNRTHYQPTEELLKRSEELGGTGVTRSGGSSYGEVTESQGTFVLNSTDDVFVFEFDGTDAALWSNYYTGDMLLVSIDGGDYKAVSGSSHAPARIVEGLNSGKHTIKVKIADATESLSIRSIFTIDYTKSTLQGTTHTYTDYANHTFTLPAGKYEVKYLDLGSIVADLGYEYAGEGLFLGLKDSEGNAVADTTALTAGMVLVPELFDVNDYFSFKGAQIRVKSEEKDQGLRFVVEKLASVDEKVNVSEFGMVVIPSAILGDDRAYTDYDASVENSTANIVGADELVAGAVFTVNDKQYAVKTVVAEKIFEQGEDSLSYTTCITGITSDKYAKYYTLKPYVKFTVDGVEYVEYADAFRSSIYEVAKAISADETAGEDVKAVAEEVISTVEQ